MLLTTVQTGMDTLTADVNAYKTLNQKILDLSNAWDNGAYVDLDLPRLREIPHRFGNGTGWQDIQSRRSRQHTTARRPDLDVGNKEGLTKWGYRQCDWDNE